MSSSQPADKRAETLSAETRRILAQAMRGDAELNDITPEAAKAAFAETHTSMNPYSTRLPEGANPEQVALFTYTSLQEQYLMALSLTGAVAYTFRAAHEHFTHHGEKYKAIGLDPDKAKQAVLLFLNHHFDYDPALHVAAMRDHGVDDPRTKNSTFVQQLDAFRQRAAEERKSKRAPPRYSAISEQRVRERELRDQANLELKSKIPPPKRAAPSAVSSTPAGLELKIDGKATVESVEAGVVALHDAARHLKNQAYELHHDMTELANAVAAGAPEAKRGDVRRNTGMLTALMESALSSLVTADAALLGISRHLQRESGADVPHFQENTSQLEKHGETPGVAECTFREAKCAFAAANSAQSAARAAWLEAEAQAGEENGLSVPPEWVFGRRPHDTAVHALTVTMPQDTFWHFRHFMDANYEALRAATEMVYPYPPNLDAIIQFLGTFDTPEEADRFQRINSELFYGSVRRTTINKPTLLAAFGENRAVVKFFSEHDTVVEGLMEHGRESEKFAQKMTQQKISTVRRDNEMSAGEADPDLARYREVAAQLGNRQTRGGKLSKNDQRRLKEAKEKLEQEQARVKYNQCIQEYEAAQSTYSTVLDECNGDEMAPRALGAKSVVDSKRRLAQDARVAYEQAGVPLDAVAIDVFGTDSKGDFGRSTMFVKSDEAVMQEGGDVQAPVARTMVSQQEKTLGGRQ